MNQRRQPWTARRIHLWVSIALAIPMLLMAVSGILIAMRSVMHVQVPMSWMGAETAPERLPIMAFAQTADGTVWIGNAQGLHAIRGQQVQTVDAFKGQEVVGLAPLADQAMPLVATRMAIWSETEGNWTAVRRGRVRQLLALPDGGALGIAGGRGEMADGKPLFTRNGVDWQPYMPAIKANKQLPPLDDPHVALHQFMRELHSGAYFFGKGPGEIGWSNVMGWVLVLLSLTGLWMWGKRELERRRPAPSSAGAVSSRLEKVASVAPGPAVPAAATQVHLQGHGDLPLEPGVLLNTLWEHLPGADCQAGECGGCKLQLLEGSVRWIREPLADVDRDTHVLACSCEPQGPIRCALVTQ